MNTKWYISTLFLVFIYFGSFHEPISIPNQEIVLEFVDAKINQKDIASTIFDVKEKLLKAGVSNINIQETKNGTLKISYYSADPKDNIKKALAEDNKLLLNQNPENNKEDKNAFNYSIDIYDITDISDISKSKDKFVLDIKNNFDRSTTYTSIAFLKTSKESILNNCFNTAFKRYKNKPFTKDKTSNSEPEVRAGPNTYSI